MNKQERKEYNKKYYQQNSTRIKEYHKKYYQENRENFREYHKKAWQKRHKNDPEPLIMSKKELKNRLPQLLKQNNHRTLPQICHEIEQITSKKLGTSPPRIIRYLQQHHNITNKNGVWSYHDI